MEECDQAEQKIDLKEAEESQFLKLSEAEMQAPALLRPQPPAQHESVTTALEWQMAAANIKPLPARFIEGASATQALNRPLPLLGQAFGLFSVVAALAWLWAHHMLSLSTGVAVFIVPVALAWVFATVMITLMKMQAKSWTELLGGAMHPLVWFDKKMFLPLSVGVLADTQQGYNNYLLAAACYAEVVRSAHPLDVLSDHRSFERELIISLAYAGKFEKSLFYADNAVRYAEYLLSTVNTEASRNYFGFATRTAAMAYELAGNSQRANQLREMCYEFTKDLPFTEEARLFGNMAKSEAYCLLGDYDKALPLLTDFVEHVAFGFKMTSDPVLRSRAYHLLAICYAHLGEIERAQEMHELGVRNGGSDFSTYVAAEGVCAEAQILRLSGNIDDADTLIEEALKKLRVQRDSVLCRRLTTLHSDPSKCTADLSADQDHDEVNSGYDDEPMPVPILMDDHIEKGSLQRTEFGFLLLALSIPIFNQNCQYLFWTVPIMIAIVILTIRSRNKQIKVAASAIATGTPHLVKVKIGGSKNLSLYRDGGNSEHFTAFSSEPWRKLHSVAGDSLFEAVAYANDAEEVTAVQVLGFYACVKPFGFSLF